MQLHLRHIAIHPDLKEFVERIFVLETDGRVPDPDLKIIVPNGSVKLVIPIRNGIIGQRDGYSRLSKVNQMTLVGISDLPFTVDSEHDKPSILVTVEFSVLGAYRFCNIRHSELKNKIFLLDEILGKAGQELEALIANTANINDKLKLIEQFLIKTFSKAATDTIFNYCVKKIKYSNGAVTIATLEKETGYSSRWLNMKFDERIGLNPKTLCAIIRFQYVFQALAKNPGSLKGKLFYDIYYDQSHFIKEFKRFTGMAPAKFESHENDFSKIFYKD